MSIAYSKISFSNNVKNLGIVIDHDLPSSSNVNSLISSMYPELKQTAKIRMIPEKFVSVAILNYTIALYIMYIQCYSFIGHKMLELKKTTTQKPCLIGS